MHNIEILDSSFYIGIERDWVREQLVLKYRKKRDASTFLNLREIYQSRRNHEAEFKKYGIVLRHGKFADIGRISY